MINYPPATDEFELSVFGPGVEECLVLHLGDNQWVIIDSCTDYSSNNPIALDYLCSIGVNPSTDVCLVLISHWHDDHIKGISKIIETCTNALVSLSIAYTKEEFTTYIQARHNTSPHINSGASELYKVIEILTSNIYKRKYTYIIPAIAGMQLIEFNHSLNHKISIKALSPSIHNYHLFIDEIIDYLRNHQDNKRARIKQDENQISVVLSVNIGSENLLLGADLPFEANSRTGWQAILNIRHFIIPKSNVFKIPHHGSDTSYHPSIWTNLLNPNPIAILTPYISGKLPRPSENDIANILQHTDHVYCANQVKGWKPKKLPSHSFKEKTSFIINRTRITGNMGHVRLRHKINIKPTLNDICHNSNAFCIMRG